MTVVDPALLAELERASNKRVPVLMVCQGDCESVVKALEGRGIRIISTESMVLGTVAAEITADQLSVVQSISGISAVELDQEARALQ